MRLDYFFIKDGKNNFRVFYESILYIQGCKKYSRVVTANREYLLSTSLDKMENELSSRNFCRIHKSYIISLRHITVFNNEIANIGEKQIPIGRCYRGLLSKRVTLWGAATNFVKVSRKDIDDLIDGMSGS